MLGTYTEYVFRFVPIAISKVTRVEENAETPMERKKCMSAIIPIRTQNKAASCMEKRYPLE